MADPDIDAQLQIISERHRKAVANHQPMQAQLLILDADQLLDAKLISVG
jgi:hypothetical protein